MRQSRKKILRRLGLALLLGVAGASLWFVYQWYKPHRDIQASPHDLELSAAAFVEEYLTDAAAANKKYLSPDGDSKILVLEGRVASIDSNQQGAPMLHLRAKGQKHGVNCVLLRTQRTRISQISTGDLVRIKGVVRSGAGSDPDLGLIYHALLEKCALYEPEN